MNLPHDDQWSAPSPAIFWVPAFFFAHRWGDERLRADICRVFGDPASVTRHERAANRALLGIRALLVVRRLWRRVVA